MAEHRDRATGSIAFKCNQIMIVVDPNIVVYAHRADLIFTMLPTHRLVDSSAGMRDDFDKAVVTRCRSVEKIKAPD